MRAMLVAGARPNFVKVKPTLDALEAAGADTVLVHTGQHYDDVLDRAMFDDLQLRAPDHALGVGSGTHAQQVARVMTALEPIIESERPDVVVVFGDVNSTLGAALVAARSGAALAHVEAGLRSGDWTMPEELNRCVVDRVSDFLFAPSADAVDNLRREGVDDRQISHVGNVMVDSLLRAVPRARERPTLDELELEPGGYVLATLHRPATVDDPAALDGVLDALGEIALEMPVVLPSHPRTLAALRSRQAGTGVRVLRALGYLDFVALELGAAVVITDSGGVQEETTVLGVPCLTVRTTTERPVTVSVGTNRVVGLDRHDIVAAWRSAPPRREIPSVPPLWDGAAGQRIADILAGTVGRGEAGRHARAGTLVDP